MEWNTWMLLPGLPTFILVRSQIYFRKWPKKCQIKYKSNINRNWPEKGFEKPKAKQKGEKPRLKNLAVKGKHWHFLLPEV